MLVAVFKTVPILAYLRHSTRKRTRPAIGAAFQPLHFSASKKPKTVTPDVLLNPNSLPHVTEPAYRKSAYLRQTTNQLLYRFLHPTAEYKRIQRVYMRIFWVVFVCDVLIFFVLLVTAPAVLARLPLGAGSIPPLTVILAGIVWQIRAIVQELKANEAAGMAPAPQTPEETSRLISCGTVFLFIAGWWAIGSDLHWDFFVTFGGLAGVAIVGAFSSRVTLWYLQRRDRHRAAQQ